MATKMLYKLFLRIFFGSWAALCSHSMIYCQIGIYSLTASTMKLRISTVLLVLVSSMVVSLYFASAYAACKMIGLRSGLVERSYFILVRV